LPADGKVLALVTVGAAFGRIGAHSKARFTCKRICKITAATS
jgi:hypothetical protein